MNSYFKTGFDETLLEIRAVDTDVIVLSEMHFAIPRVANAVVLVGFGAAFDNGDHDKQQAARLKDAIEFLQRLTVIDVLQHMTAKDDVVLVIGNWNVFNVPVSVNVRPKKICA